jgi:hypothetical protein
MSLLSPRTNSTGSSKLLGLSVTTSIYGSGITIVLGTARIPANTIWIGDWTPHAVSTGGKGGGGKGSGKNGGGQNTYSLSYIQALCMGPIAGVGQVWQDKTVLDPSVFPTFLLGAQAQAPWGFLTSNHPAEAIGYSEIALAAAANSDLGSAGTIPNYTYEVKGQQIFGSGIPDALATDAINYVLTNRNCAGFSSGLLGDISAVKNYCLANSLFISPVIDQQQTLQSYLTEYLLVANAEAFESEGKLKFGTYGDTAASSTWGTFTPSTAPQYDLDFDDFISGPGQNPITFSFKPTQDAPNTISLEFTNRDRDYNLETASDEEFDHVRKYGQNIASPATAHSITTRAVVAKVLSVQLKRGIHMLRQCAFTLGWKYSLLEPMDIVSVPEQYPSSGRIAARILTIDEDDNGNLAFTCEVLPYPISAPTVHPKQTTGGFLPGFTANPGFVNPPIFFEATQEMTQTLGYMLMIALSGGPNWGGASVHVSDDGTTYSYDGVVSTSSNMGHLTADYAFGLDPDTVHTLSVDLSPSRGVILPASQDDADKFQPLALIDQELVSYTAATLTGSNRYDLGSYLRRGVFGSNETLHKSGAAFTLLDGNQYEYAYQPTDIGKTKWFKFTSFNAAGQNEQDIAAVTAYPWTVTAPYVRGPMPWRPFDETVFSSPTKKGIGLAQHGDFVDVKGYLPINQFSPTITAPVIDAVGVVVGHTGNTLPVGDWVMQVFGIDSSGLYSPGSGLVEFTITATAQRVQFAANFPAGTVNHEVFFGPDIDHLYSLSIISGATSGTQTFDVISPVGYGPPNPRANSLHVQAARETHGGIFDTNVLASTTSSVTIVPPTALTAGFLTGRTMSLMSKSGLPATQPNADEIITGNTTGGVLSAVNIPPGIGPFPPTIGPGDLVMVRTMANAATLTTIQDTGWVNPWATAGLTTNQDAGKLLVILRDPTYPPLTGETVTILSNTADTHTVTPFSRVPGVGTIYAIVDPIQSLDFVTEPFSNALQPGSYPLQTVATVPAGALEGYIALFRVNLRDADGNDSDDPSDTFRELYIVPGQGLLSTGDGYTTITPASGIATVDLANGLNQRLVLNGTAVAIPPPVFTGGVISTGMSFTLYVDQDATGGRAAPLFSPGTIASGATISGAITASTTSIPFAADPGFTVGQTIWIGTERLQVSVVYTAGVVVCIRGASGTTAASHSSGAAVLLAALNGFSSDTQTQDPITTASTRSIYTFTFHGSVWGLDSFRTGASIT